MTVIRRHHQLLVLAAGLSGAACGTMGTRTIGPVCGGAPFAAVAWDVVAMTKVFGPTERLLDIDWSGPWLFTGGLVSLPVDLAIDVVALPFDLVAWAFGHEKNALWSQRRNPPDARGKAAVPPRRRGS